MATFTKVRAFRGVLPEFEAFNDDGAATKYTDKFVSRYLDTASLLYRARNSPNAYLTGGVVEKGPTEITHIPGTDIFKIVIDSTSTPPLNINITPSFPDKDAKIVSGVISDENLNAVIDRDAGKLNFGDEEIDIPTVLALSPGASLDDVATDLQTDIRADNAFTDVTVVANDRRLTITGGSKGEIVKPTGSNDDTPNIADLLQLTNNAKYTHGNSYEDIADSIQKELRKAYSMINRVNAIRMSNSLLVLFAGGRYGIRDIGGGGNTLLDFPTGALAQAMRLDEDSAIFDEGTSEITFYAAAHLLTMDTEGVAAPDGGSMVITEEKIGEEMVKYEARKFQDDHFWQQTPYGRIFLELKKQAAYYIHNTPNVTVKYPGLVGV